VLQRERDFDVPVWLWGGASAVVVALYLSLIAALSWGVGRIGRPGRPRLVPPEQAPAADAGPLVRKPAPAGVR
jgi:hypothetical protein